MAKDMQSAVATSQVVSLERGYDVSKAVHELTEEEIRDAAAFRGGKFLGPSDKIGVPFQVFSWECEHGHRFDASLEYVLLGGGWCERCLLDQVMTPSELNVFSSQIRSRL